MLLEKDIRAIQDQLGHVEGVPNEISRLGVTVVDIGQVGQQLTDRPSDYDLLFTPIERAHCREKIPSYAGRYAGKRAIVDVLGQEIPWGDITIDRDQSGKPHVELTRDALRLAAEQGIQSIPISIAHDEGLAVGFAVGLVDPHSNATLGTDIASVRRVRRIYEKLGDHFMRRVFSAQEAQEAHGDVIRLAEMWAGKEAVAKVLGTGVWGAGVAWTDISILTEDSGLSHINLTGKALEQADRCGFTNWKVHILPNSETPMAFVCGNSIH